MQGASGDRPTSKTKRTRLQTAQIRDPKSHS
jgi:hypothetical protein